MQGFGHPSHPATEHNLGEHDLVPGALVAYRQFLYMQNYLDGRPALTAVNQRYGAFASGVNEAECLATDFGPQHRRDADGELLAPDRECTCGFYAYFRMADVPNVGAHSGITANSVVAAVELTGRTVMGTKGCRAQKMKILGVVPPKCVATSIEKQIGDTWQRLVRQYELVVYPTISDLTAAHPASDVYDLIPQVTVSPEAFDQAITSVQTLQSAARSAAYTLGQYNAIGLSPRMGQWVTLGDPAGNLKPEDIPKDRADYFFKDVSAVKLQVFLKDLSDQLRAERTYGASQLVNIAYETANQADIDFLMKWAVALTGATVQYSLSMSRSKTEGRLDMTLH
jgi:hypothetical protein